MPKHGRGIAKNGRSKPGESFVKLPHWVMDCAAFRELKPGPRALLLELVRRFNGRNNGLIGMGERAAAERLNMSDRAAVRRYFRELEAFGFIARTRVGAFSLKARDERRATEWRLTWLPTGAGEKLQLATKEFARWKRPRENAE